MVTRNWKAPLGIDHLTVLCSVARPLIKSEAGVDFGLKQISLLLSCKSRCNANEFYLCKKSSEVFGQTRSTPASLLFKGLATEHRTVTWSILIKVLKLDLSFEVYEFLRPVASSSIFLGAANGK